VCGVWFSGIASEPIRLQHGEKDTRKGKERKAVKNNSRMKKAEGRRVV